MIMDKHQYLERNSILLLIATVIVISIGGLVEVVPLFRTETTIEKVDGVRPLTPLELIGFNVYLSEGCHNCHTQQIRPLRDEVERYGHYSLAAESMYDHPFQWGSKRTGPDIARVGGKYSDTWHVDHLINPQSVVRASVMPQYPHLTKKVLDVTDMADHLKALRGVGVPYTDEQIKFAVEDAKAQARDDSDGHDGLAERYGERVNMRNFDSSLDLTEMDALVAYLQMLGTLADLRDYEPNWKARAAKGEAK